MSKYEVKFTKQFKKDLKLLEWKHKDIKLLKQIVFKLANGEQLPIQYRNHELTNNWIGHRECHIQPDWILIYRIESDVLVLTLSRTGTHSDLF